MRIWDLPPEVLCRRHLLGEHAELHALWNVLTRDMKGFSNHPETRRWRGKLKALYRRHQALVEEMERRGYRHGSPLEEELAAGEASQEDFVDTPAEQMEILKAKGCDCDV